MDFFSPRVIFKNTLKYFGDDVLMKFGTSLKYQKVLKLPKSITFLLVFMLHFSFLPFGYSIFWNETYNDRLLFRRGSLAIIILSGTHFIARKVGPGRGKKTNSVQFSCSVVSDSLRPHESQHARPPCPSSAPGVHSDSRPSSWWCHPAISSSVVPFSSCPQSLPASESSPMSQLFAWGGRSTGED